MEVKFTFDQVIKSTSKWIVSEFGLYICAEYPCLPSIGCQITLKDDSYKERKSQYWKNCINYIQWLVDPTDKDNAKINFGAINLNKWGTVKEIYSVKEGEFIVVLD